MFCFRNPKAWVSALSFLGTLISSPVWSENPPGNCVGTEAFRLRAQLSIDGGTTWLSDSASICVSVGATVDLAARTLLTVTSGQTEGWSFSLKQSAPWAAIYGGGLTVVGVTTNGTGTATVQGGSGPDSNSTSIRGSSKG